MRDRRKPPLWLLALVPWSLLLPVTFLSTLNSPIRCMRFQSHFGAIFTQNGCDSVGARGGHVARTMSLPATKTAGVGHRRHGHDDRSRVVTRGDKGGVRPATHGQRHLFATDARESPKNSGQHSSATTFPKRTYNLVWRGYIIRGPQIPTQPAKKCQKRKSLLYKTLG